MAKKERRTTSRRKKLDRRKGAGEREREEEKIVSSRRHHAFALVHFISFFLDLCRDAASCNEKEAAAEAFTLRKK